MRNILHSALGLFAGLAVAIPTAQVVDPGTSQSGAGRPGGGGGGGGGGGRPGRPGGPFGPPNGPFFQENCNTPSNRACWVRGRNGFNINTDYEERVPYTGQTKHYDFVITEVPNWVGPDGHVNDVGMLINDQFPGPVVEANWGDIVEITVHNNLDCNGTSIHWHGIRMQENSVNDGANGVTECPIAPGTSKTYRFLAEQYGTSWYHSHYSAQYGNGIVGSILIHGPASLPYDVDLGVFPITDFYYRSSERIQLDLIPFPGAAPRSDNVLFNGSHVDGQGNGEYARVKLEPGKRHLLRLINPSVDNTFTVSLVGHDMTVIATDFVPVNAYTTSSLFMAVGQRYDVTIDASKAPDNYWFNITFSSTGACGLVDASIPPPAAIFQYANAPEGIPTVPGTPPPESLCQDNTSFTPVVTRSTGVTSFPVNSTNDIPIDLITKEWEGQQRVYWNVHGHDMNITWDEPTLEYVARGEMDFPERYNVHRVDNADQWSFWVIENTSPVPHPMHLHGHDFLVLGHSAPQASPFTSPVVPFNPATDLATLNHNNPTRRDSTMLPANGWVVLAFRVDNPGAWLFHCHIAWHVGQGLSLQFLERVDEIPDTVALEELEPNCAVWTAYYEQSECKKIDSGLKKLKRSDPSSM